MAQIIPSNVLEEQTVIVGPQYAERLIHHSPPRPHLRLRTCSGRVLPGGAEQRVALADQQITDHPLLVCWYLKHLPGDFRNVAVCCGDNHITESTDGGGTHLSICTKRIVCVRLSHTGDQSETFWNASVREEEKGL